MEMGRSSAPSQATVTRWYVSCRVARAPRTFAEPSRVHELRHQQRGEGALRRWALGRLGAELVPLSAYKRARLISVIVRDDPAAELRHARPRSGREA